MEVFISHLDSKTTKEQLQTALQPSLQRLSIDCYNVHKTVGKTFGFLTVSDFNKGLEFLTTARQHPSLVVTTLGRQARFDQSKKPPNEQLLRVLQKEEKDAKIKKTRLIGKSKDNDRNDTQDHTEGLRVLSIECGHWETASSGKTFNPYFSLSSEGRLIRDAQNLITKLHREPPIDLVMPISTIQSCAIAGASGKQVVVITLANAPKIYERQDLEGPFETMMSHFGPAKKNTLFRDTKLPGCDSTTMGSCLAYRLTMPTLQGETLMVKRLRSMTSNQVEVVRAPSLSKLSFPTELKADAAALNSILREWTFLLRFQIEKLWSNGFLSPREVASLVPEMARLRATSGDQVTIFVLRRLIVQLQVADVQASSLVQARTIMRQREAYSILDSNIDQQRSFRDEVNIHNAVVTPAGVYLYGPEEFAANRILRKHRANQDCFLRVTFSDENSERLEFDRDVSNERVLRGRFQRLLDEGLNIAGEHFDFLGFSHSSLRSQSCWFMRPFEDAGQLVNARSLIQALGDFSSFHCPAKCAARIGQAFSETTSAVTIDPSIVVQQSDTRAGNYIFTDGCGTVSRQTWKLLRGNHKAKEQPTLYQIRYKGSKGMISLDSRLHGHQMLIRQSMIKFTGSPSTDIEICGTNSRALPFKLNRPLIKILEDLRIPTIVFERLQEQAVNNLQSSARSAASAVDFIRLNLRDTATGLPALLGTLSKTDINVTEDAFLRELLGALLQIQLRQIKYRSRILVPDARTLYGICDETGYLEEGQVYVTYNDEDTRVPMILQGRVAVTRSPALHPGDIQVAKAVCPPTSSSLLELSNCIVFSSKGSRDLPSMLSGGDLDGDLYNVIFDKDLIPSIVETPAAYLPAQAVDIGRPVGVADMTKFFIDFMQNDQLGRIATLHQVFADDVEGTRSSQCLKLAELHSNAVDFSKSGVPVNPRDIPRAPPYRPDFMAPSASTKVDKGIKRPTDRPADLDTPQRYRYYESDRVLGRLYRAIDEDLFFDDLEDDTSSVFSKDASDNVLFEILQWVKDSMHGRNWRQYLAVAQEVRDYYESAMLDIMTQYATARTDHVTEKEVFIGTIMGRSGAGSKYQRDQSDFMKAQFNRELRDTRSWMESHWQVVDVPDGLLCLAVACLYLAAREPSNIPVGRMGPLKSFGWYAAGMCVPELVKEATEKMSRLSEAIIEPLNRPRTVDMASIRYTR